MDWLLETARMFFYIIPFYVANSSAMIFGGKTPVDLNLNLRDGQRLFGKGKTFKGCFFGILAGTIASAIILFFFPSVKEVLIQDYVLFGFLVSLGAILGDIGGSFLKRRAKIESGNEVLFLDQLDFVFGALIVGSIVFIPSFYELIAICVLTVFVHKASNWIAFKLKLKKVPW